MNNVVQIIAQTENNPDGEECILEKATKFATPRKITIGESTKEFDGSSDLEMTLEEIGLGGVKVDYNTDDNEVTFS